jgi:hypothetical protein
LLLNAGVEDSYASSNKTSLINMIRVQSLPARIFVLILAAAGLCYGAALLGLSLSSEQALKAQIEHLSVTAEMKRDSSAKDERSGEEQTRVSDAKYVIHMLQQSHDQYIIQLIGFGTGGFAIFTALLMLIMGKIFVPLKNVAANLQLVAKGNWKTDIAYIDRPDEIGMLARSTATVQKAMEERDRLKLYMTNAEGVNKRRHDLEESIRKFEKLMRTELLDVNDGVDRMEDMARDLARFSAIAEGEAAEVAFITDHTAVTIHRMGEQSEKVEKEAASPEQDPETGVKALKKIASSPHLYHSSSQQIDTLADTLAADLEKGLQVIEQTRKANIFSTRTETEAFNAVEDAMNTSLRSITLLKQQELTTQQILTHLSKAQTGALSVSSSVKRLRSTIEETRSASVKVVATAESMAEKAVNLNLAVKSFLHNVLVH